MACPVPLTGGQFGAFGGMLGGSGLASFAPSFTALAAVAPQALVAQAAISAATGAIGANPLTELSSAVAASVAVPGASGILQSALTGQVPSAASLISGSDMIGSLVAQAATMVPTDISSITQIIPQVANFSNITQTVMPAITRGLNTQFGAIAGNVTNFASSGFTGIDIPNFDGMITNGISSITDGVGSSIADLGSGLSKLGEFGDFTDLGNLMKPGQVVGQMLDKGLGDIGDMANKLIDEGIDIANLANPLYQNKIQEVMNTITGITDIADIQQAMGSQIPGLANLGDVTNMKKVLDQNIPLVINNFTELGERFEIRGASSRFGKIANLGEMGDLMSNIETTDDLTLLASEESVLDQTTFNAIESVYGGGSGPDGSVLVRDVLASAAGYGHDVYLDVYSTATTQLNSDGVTATLEAMYSELSAGIAGSYTVGSDITDPRTSIVYTNDLDAFVTAKVAQISGEMSVLANITTNPYLNAARDNWNNSVNALETEITLVNQSDIDTTNISAGHVGSMWSFASRLGDMGQDEIDVSHVLERLATNDKAGEFVKFSLREGRNVALFADKDIQYPVSIRGTAELPDEWEDPSDVIDPV